MDKTLHCLQTGIFHMLLLPLILLPPGVLAVGVGLGVGE